MRSEDKGIVLLKLSLYCISLWILMFMLIVLKMDVSMINKKMGLNAWKNFFCANVFSWICIFFIFAGLIGYVYFKDYLKNAKRLPVEIEDCESVNYENLSFLESSPYLCVNSLRYILHLIRLLMIVAAVELSEPVYHAMLPTL